MPPDAPFLLPPDYQNKEISMFEVGELVVCIDAEPRKQKGSYRSGTGRPLVKGRVYTVEGWRREPKGGGQFVELEEVEPPPSCRFWAFHPDRFRPLPSSQISLINSMLVTAKDKERV